MLRPRGGACGGHVFDKQRAVSFGKGFNDSPSTVVQSALAPNVLRLAEEKIDKAQKLTTATKTDEKKPHHPPLDPVTHRGWPEAGLRRLRQLDVPPGT